MRIERVEAILVDLPTIRVHQLSMATVQAQTLVIVRLWASDGIVGVGEATTIGGLSYGEESPEGIKVAIDTYLAPALLGCDPTGIHAAMATLNRVARNNRFAKSAIETALLDAQARRLQISVATLLGGAVTTALPVLWGLASGNTAHDVAEAEARLASGQHTRFKLKIGRRDPAADVAHVVAVTRALGDRARVTVDVNQAWEESQAKRAIAALEEAGVELVEQPIARHNLDGLARLTQRFLVPIMADEAVNGPEEALAIARRGAADIISLKIGKAGGLFTTLKVAAIAEASGIGLYGGTMLEGTIGTVASAHVFSTLSALRWGTELFGPLLLANDIVATPLEYRDGLLHLPDGPGLGVTLDEDKLAFHRRDRTSGRRVVVDAVN